MKIKTPFCNSKPHGLYVYVVACVGAFSTIREYVRLRGQDRNDNAISIARSKRGGCLAYSVESVEDGASSI